MPKKVRIAIVLDLCTVLAALGCREEDETPMAPVSAPPPALDVTPAQALAFRQVSAGEHHTCGVTRDDVAYCWGANLDGTLGNGTDTGLVTRPARVTGVLGFHGVQAGGSHTCALTSAGYAYCWGNNGFGQLGIGTQTGPACDGVSCRNRPVQVTGKLRFRQVSLGESHTCGVTTENVAYCWGFNLDGQLGNGSDTGPQTCGLYFRGACSTRPVPVAGNLRFRQVSAGTNHTCGVTPENVAYCWGSNSAAELGNGTIMGAETCSSGFPCSTRPTRVTGRLAFRGVAAGGSHTCALTTAGKAYCWGDNSVGQLGEGTQTGPEICLDGDSFCSARPVRVVGGLVFDRMSAGGAHTCGVTAGYDVYCWGANSPGQLGDGTGTGPEGCSSWPCSTRPHRVVGRLAFRGVQAGGSHTCGVTADHVAYCWGANWSGQLGQGTSTGPETCLFENPCSTRPVAVSRPGL